MYGITTTLNIEYVYCCIYSFGNIYSIIGKDNIKYIDIGDIDKYVDYIFEDILGSHCSSCGPNTTKRSNGHGFSYEIVSSTLSLAIATPFIHCETCRVRLKLERASANRSTFPYADARYALPRVITQPLNIPAAAFARRAAVIHRNGLAIEVHSSA